ncbi:MAG TPA: DUF881 domain-containing protein [Propionibacteriaceae bacterium]|nr:DUF881 domain-containing protein [Propionibacteriaceae bacterium]
MQAPDASMDLLRQLREEAVDPDYARAASDGRATRNPGAMSAIALVIAGALFATALVSTTRSKPLVTSERAQLMGYIREAEARQDQLRTDQAALRAQVDTIQKQALGGSASLPALSRTVAIASGAVPVTGPGVVIVVDDAAASASVDGRVLDQDLAQLVNGLWAAGAEAVAVNGHRITTRTAIREAGSAITVDYRSLDRPYRVEAIGDPRKLPADFTATTGGSWWAYLNRNYGLAFDLQTSDALTLPADPGLGLTVATRAR